MFFIFNAMSQRGRFWVAYFLLLIVGWFAFCGAALAHTEKHGHPIPAVQEPDVPQTPRSRGRWLDESLDPWSTKDKRDHLTISAIIGAGIEAYKPDAHWSAKWGVCMVPGVLKEVYDVRKPGGTASWRDLVANGVGCGIGGLSYKGIRAIVTPRGSSLVIDRTF